jgi:hypothetical protein
MVKSRSSATAVRLILLCLRGFVFLATTEKPFPETPAALLDAA